MTKTNRGFTLIELLVVIAIIGILSSVVLASLNTARGKGANAAVKSNLNNIRAQAELVYDSASPNTYAGVCVDANVSKGVTAAGTAGGGTGFCYSPSGGTLWVAAAPLKTAEGSYTWWCVDNTGSSKGEASAVTGTPANCP